MRLRHWRRMWRVVVTIWNFHWRRWGWRVVVTVRNFNWNLDVFLTDILDICVAFFFVKLFCHQFEISVAFLFLRGSTLFFGNIGVGHVAGLVH